MNYAKNINIYMLFILIEVIILTFSNHIPKSRITAREGLFSSSTASIPDVEPPIKFVPEEGGGSFLRANAVGTSP
jgi:hypothetical protein